MFRKKFKVLGEDVDDFMVMQKSAYYSYVLLSVKSVLPRIIHSIQKPNALEVLIQRSSSSFTIQKNLMFTQQFFVNIEFQDFNKKEGIVYVRNRFFNETNELCAFGTTKLLLLHQHHQKTPNMSSSIINRLIDESYSIS